MTNSPQEGIYTVATSLPPTSLIICSRNRQGMLAQAVESVLRGDEVPTELIIIDQSNCPRPELAMSPTDHPCEIRYVWTRSVGVSQGRNEGIAAARHEVLVFTDDDTLVTPTWFGTLVRALASQGPRGVVTGQVRPTEEVGHFQLSVKVDGVTGVYEGRVGEEGLFPPNMAMHRSVIEEVGNFDVRMGPGTRFPAAEDNDFGFRLLEAGYRIIYVPDAVLYHRAWRNEHDILTLWWRYGIGQGAFYAKHLSFRDRYMLSRLGREMARNTYGVLLRAFRRDRYGALARAVYSAGILYGSLRWSLSQRRIL